MSNLYATSPGSNADDSDFDAGMTTPTGAAASHTAKVAAGEASNVGDTAAHAAGEVADVTENEAGKVAAETKKQAKDLLTDALPSSPSPACWARIRKGDSAAIRIRPRTRPRSTL